MFKKTIKFYSYYKPHWGGAGKFNGHWKRVDRKDQIPKELLESNNYRTHHLT